MPTNTERLDLFKYDVVADANSTFNITNALNDNWDKIDNQTAKDYDVVHNTGDETIEGEKTFENPLTVNDTSTFNNNITLDDGQLILNDNGVYTSSTIRVNLSNQTDSSAGAYQTDITAYRSSGVRASNLRMGYNNTQSGGISELNVCNSSGSITGGIGIYSTASGTVTTKAPTPPANNSSTQIATTAFVKDCFTNSRSNFITFSKSSNGYIKFSNGIMIQWGRAWDVPSGTTITYPVAFKSWAIPVIASHNTIAVDPDDIVIHLYDTLTTGFKVGLNSSKWAVYGMWLAAGY